MHVVRYTCIIYCLISALTIPVGDTEMHERSNNLPVHYTGSAMVSTYMCIYVPCRSLEIITI